MTTYYPAFISCTMSFLITYPAATGAGSWCKKRCKARALFPRKMEISSQSVPLQLLNMGVPGKKKASKALFFWTVVFKEGCVTDIVFQHSSIQWWAKLYLTAALPFRF